MYSYQNRPWETYHTHKQVTPEASMHNQKTSLNTQKMQHTLMLVSLPQFSSAVAMAIIIVTIVIMLQTLLYGTGFG